MDLWVDTGIQVLLKGLSTQERPGFLTLSPLTAFPPCYPSIRLCYATPQAREFIYSGLGWMRYVSWIKRSHQ